MTTDFQAGRIRVLLVTGSYPPMRCGVGDYTQRLAEALAGLSNVRVSVLTSHEAGAANSHDPVAIYPTMRGWRLPEFVRVLRVIRKERPDIFHVQYPTRGYGRGLLPTFLPLLGWLGRSRVVQTWHELHSGRGPRAIVGFLTKGLVPGGLIVVRPNYAPQVPTEWRWVLKRKRFRTILNASAIPRVRLDPDERNQIRQVRSRDGSMMIVYFGFMHERKDTHLLFEIADPERDHLLLIGECDPTNSYHQSLLDRARSARWSGKVTFAGFLPAAEVAGILAAADAVVLPFADGGGEWNTSIHAAQAQGTFVLTTSMRERGYARSLNTYFASPKNVVEMREALTKYVGVRVEPKIDGCTWTDIADEHLRVYQEQLMAHRASNPLAADG